MTVRQGKRLTWVFGALVLAAMVIDVISFYLRPDRFRLTDAAMPVLFLVLFVTLRQHYRRLEAAHGPDYDLPIKGRRVWLLLLGVLVAIGAAAIAYLLATR
jgi:4-amino-4-deoxy-L-arabinose transferase-like glycosyltransferase